MSKTQYDIDTETRRKSVDEIKVGDLIYLFGDSMSRKFLGMGTVTKTGVALKNYASKHFELVLRKEINTDKNKDKSATLTTVSLTSFGTATNLKESQVAKDRYKYLVPVVPADKEKDSGQESPVQLFDKDKQPKEYKRGWLQLFRTNKLTIYDRNRHNVVKTYGFLESIISEKDIKRLMELATSNQEVYDKWAKEEEAKGPIAPPKHVRPKPDPPIGAPKGPRAFGSYDNLRSSSSSSSVPRGLASTSHHSTTTQSASKTPLAGPPISDKDSSSSRAPKNAPTGPRKGPRKQVPPTNTSTTSRKRSSDVRSPPHGDDSDNHTHKRQRSGDNDS